MCQTFELYRLTSTARAFTFAFGWKTRTRKSKKIAGERQRGSDFEARQLRQCMIAIEIEIARNVHMHNPSALLLKEAYCCMYRHSIEHIRDSIRSPIRWNRLRPARLACDR
jgi:hypothetical protein